MLTSKVGSASAVIAIVVSIAVAVPSAQRSTSPGARQRFEPIYRLNSRPEAETMRLLNDDVVLCTLANRAGMELVSDWYMRDADEKSRSINYIPRLYQNTSATTTTATST